MDTKKKELPANPTDSEVKATVQKNSNPRKYNFALMLYNEWENFDEILGNALYQCAKYAYITHDKDIDEDGDVKKAHTHVWVTYNNACTLTALAKRIGIDKRFIQYANDDKSRIRYLVHLDDPKKYQYKREDIHSNTDLSFAFRNEKNEGECVLELIELTHKMSSYDTIKYAVQNNIYDVLRRNWNIIKECKYDCTQREVRKVFIAQKKSTIFDEVGRIFDEQGREIIIVDKDGTIGSEEITI